jgi:predicted RNA binding protein YcfA (HicA-like mRNA interferase family)
MPRPYTSEEIINVLDEMNFTLVRRNGSHAVFKYRPPDDEGDTRSVTVPVGKDPLATGTLQQISKQAGANSFHAFCEWVDDVLENM